MLSRLVTYLFLSAVLAHTFSQAIIVADYLLNTELITKVFCVNKDKPQLHCNGQCHLAKQLKKDEEQKSANFEKNNEIILFLQSNTHKIVNVELDLHLSIKDIFNYSEPSAFEYDNTVFRPPSLFV